MPATLHRCVQRVMDKGHSESSAYAICRASLGLLADGSEDAVSPEMPDEEMHKKMESVLSNGPVIFKEFAAAHSGKNFVNGDQEFDLTEGDLRTIVRNFTSNPRQVPVLFRGDHAMGPDRADLPADGWVESVRMSGSDLIVRVKLMGGAAVAVLSDTFRGVSIGAYYAKDNHGKEVGLTLDHLLITNAPFFKDLNIAAANRPGADGEAVVYLTAHKEGDMPDTKKDAKDDTKAPSLAEAEAKYGKEIKLRDDEIVELKGKILNLTEQIETLNTKMENVSIDPEKDELKVTVAALQEKSKAQEIRELVDQGLKRGVLKGSWCEGYRGGNKGYQGTLSWFEASRFDGDMKLLKFQVDKAEPFVRLGRTFSTGTPKNGELTLTEDDRNYIRKLGIDQSTFLSAMKANDFDEFKQLTEKKES